MSKLHAGGLETDRYIVFKKCYGASVCCRTFSTRNNHQWKQGLAPAITTNSQCDTLLQLCFLLQQCHVGVVWGANRRSGFSLWNSVAWKSSLQRLTHTEDGAQRNTFILLRCSLVGLSRCHLPSTPAVLIPDKPLIVADSSVSWGPGVLRSPSRA